MRGGLIGTSAIRHPIDRREIFLGHFDRAGLGAVATLDTLLAPGIKTICSPLWSSQASAEAIYVLHAFEKKAQKTAKHNIELARSRFRELVRNRP